MKTNQPQPIYWSRLNDGQWTLYLAATGNGLAYVGSFGRPFEELAAWAGRRFPGVRSCRTSSAWHPTPLN